MHRYVCECVSFVKVLIQLVNSIGRKFSLLYEAWALALERKEKFSRAEEVLKKGIQAHALPLAKLKSALKGYELSPCAPLQSN